MKKLQRLARHSHIAHNGHPSERYYPKGKLNRTDVGAKLFHINDIQGIEQRRHQYEHHARRAHPSAVVTTAMIQQADACNGQRYRCHGSERKAFMKEHHHQQGRHNGVREENS